MAITTGTQLKMVQVSTQAKYNDISPKDSGTLYWVIESKKIYLDGTAYGFNNGDVTANLLSSLITLNPNVGDGIILNKSVAGNTLNIRGDVALAATADNLMTKEADGVAVSAITIEGMIGLTIANIVESKYGVTNGIATLDGAGKVPASQLPSFVDDVLEFSSRTAFPAIGEASKIYIAKDTNLVYRWSGSDYVEISSSLALGETASTAYRGDRGKIAYDHTFLTNNPHGVTKAQVGLGSVQNYGIATQAEAQAGASALKYMTPQRTAEAIAALAPRVT